MIEHSIAHDTEKPVPSALCTLCEWQSNQNVEYSTRQMAWFLQQINAIKNAGETSTS